MQFDGFAEYVELRHPSDLIFLILLYRYDLQS